MVTRLSTAPSPADDTDGIGDGDLTVETRHEGSTVAVLVSGCVDIGTAPLLRAVLDGVYVARPRRVELDLAGVTFLDSHALTTIVAARRRLAAQRSTLAVRRPSRSAARVLTTSGLHRVLEVA